MKLRNFIFGLIFVLGSLYLVLPSPVLPELQDSIRSDEPGDTWQHPDQKGFYTNSERSRVLASLQSIYNISLAGVKIPSYRLNYPPEESQTLVRDQLKSNYLEEIVYPMRDSLFVNGWEPKNAPVYAGKPAKEIPDISFRGIPYLSKVTLRPVNSSMFPRLFVWALIFPSLLLVEMSIRRSFAKHV